MSKLQHRQIHQRLAFVYLEFGLYLLKYAQYFNTCFAVISVDGSSFLAVALASVSSDGSSLLPNLWDLLDQFNSSGGIHHGRSARANSHDFSHAKLEKTKERRSGWVYNFSCDRKKWCVGVETFYTQSSICVSRPHMVASWVWFHFLISI